MSNLLQSVGWAVMGWTSLCGLAGLRAQDAAPAPVAELGVPVSQPRPRIDPAVQPTGLRNWSGPGSVYPGFGTSLSMGGARVMPAGPALGDPTPTTAPAPTPYTWQTPGSSSASSPTTAPMPGLAAPPAGSLAIPGSPYPGSPYPGSPYPAGPIPPHGPIASSPITSTPLPGGPGCSCAGSPAPGAAPAPDLGIDPGAACCGDGCCADGACCWGRGCCYPNERFYFSGEYLLWWVRGSPLPPLVTTGSPLNPIPGALGQPGTQVLFGGQDYNTQPFSGGRFFAGYWFGPAHVLGMEIGGFFLGPKTTSFSAASGGNPILARPFTDVTAGTGAAFQNAQPVAEGALVGGVTSDLSTFLWGTEANLRSRMCCGPNYFIDCIAGFRNVNLYEHLRINENLTLPPLTTATGLVVPGANYLIHDGFNTHNNFYGGQLGLVTEGRWGRWSVNVFGKVALGVTQQFVSIDGNTVITTAAGSQAYTGGLLAQPSNIGHQSHDVFGVIPEAGINLGYQITPHMRGFIGYNFLYWNNVVRPGNQIDQHVNTNQIPPANLLGGGPAAPTPLFNRSDFWAQGLTFGLMFRY